MIPRHDHDCNSAVVDVLDRLRVAPRFQMTRKLML